MLKTFPRYNSKEILADLRPLPAKGTVLKFGFNTITSLVDGRSTWRNEEAIRPVVEVQAKDGSWHTIGAITSVDKDGVPTCLNTVFPALGLNGTLVYEVGADANSDMIAHLLWNHPDVGGSGQGDPATPKVMHIINDEADAEARMSKRKTARAAREKAEDLEGEDLTTALLIAGLSNEGSLTQRLDRIAEYADKFPEVFLEKMNGEGIKANAQFRKALAAGVIAIDAPNHRVVFGSGSGNLMEGLHNLSTEVLANEWALRVQANPLLAESLDKEMEVAAAKKPAAKGAKK